MLDGDPAGPARPRTLVAWVTRQFLAEGATMVTLGMYANNDAARRLYTGLGFTIGQRFTTADLNAPTHVLDHARC